MAKKIIAQKFGGTSVATAECRQMVVRHVRRVVSEGYAPVVVVSAMGRKGEPYATDTLLGLIRGEGEPVSGREEDLIFHCGEIISAAMVSHSLTLSGLPAVGLTGGQARIYTDGRWRRAKMTEIDPSRMLREIEQGLIPVVAGGQGVTATDGDVTILGRGASDTSGVAVGVSLGAEKVEIYSDVPGVAVSDPKVVPKAKFLKEISYQKMYEMGIFGAKVMHPGAVLLGERSDVPIICRSTFDEAPGTLIGKPTREPSLVGIPSTGPVVLISVRNTDSPALTQEEAFDRFAAVILRSGSPTCTLIAVPPDWLRSLRDYLSSIGAKVEEVASDKSLVSLVGSPDFIARSYHRIVPLLQDLKLPIVHSEFAGHRSTFVTANDQAPELVLTLYEMFGAEANELDL